MFALCFLMMFVTAFISSSNLKIIATRASIKNLLSSSMCFVTALTSAFFYFVVFDEGVFTKDISAIFSDSRIYIAFLFEILGFWIARKNFEHNGNNITAINLPLFTSLLIIPCIAYFGNDIFGFSETLQVKYQSSSEFYLFLASMAVLIILFFSDKIKGGGIKSRPLLVAAPMTISFTLYIELVLILYYLNYNVGN